MDRISPETCRNAVLSLQHFAFTSGSPYVARIKLETMKGLSKGDLESLFFELKDAKCHCRGKEYFGPCTVCELCEFVSLLMDPLESERVFRMLPRRGEALACA
jgi:hypothetical protein